MNQNKQERTVEPKREYERVFTFANDDGGES